MAWSGTAFNTCSTFYELLIIQKPLLPYCHNTQWYDQPYIFNSWDVTRGQSTEARYYFRRFFLIEVKSKYGGFHRCFLWQNDVSEELTFCVIKAAGDGAGFLFVGAVSYSETSVNVCATTSYSIPEGSHLQTRWNPEIKFPGNFKCALPIANSVQTADKQWERQRDRETERQRVRSSQRSAADRRVSIVVSFQLEPPSSPITGVFS
jgi:hypothetical protein